MRIGLGIGFDPLDDMAHADLDIVAIGQHDQRQHPADIALATRPEAHRLHDHATLRIAL